MELLQKDVKALYFRYLAAAFGSAMISSIYGLVDMAMVGRYQGPDGTAALAVVAPVWNIIYSLGLLTGIGGSVLLGSARGSENRRLAGAYFTASVILTTALAAVSWGAIAFFDREMLLLFGAEDTLLPLARAYLLPIKFVVPVFLFNQMLAAFLRNDGNPSLATVSVLLGGIVNIIGDYLFVFGLGMGIKGAGLATAIGSSLSCACMVSHFFTRKNTLRLIRPSRLMERCRGIAVTGFSTFFIDVAMGILTVLFNRQIQRYAGTDALAVYGIIVNISTIVQCCAYSAGQAAQPILSMNYGAKHWDRIRETLKYAIFSVAFFSIVWTAAALAFPRGFVSLFMAPTERVLAIAPGIIRRYSISFLLLPVNIFSTYYFQSLLKPVASLVVSVSRGLVISAILIFALPALFGGEAMWYAMPLTELVVAAGVVFLIAHYTKTLDAKDRGAAFSQNSYTRARPR